MYLIPISASSYSYCIYPDTTKRQASPITAIPSSYDY
jgi:hypothetical protein